MSVTRESIYRDALERIVAEAVDPLGDCLLCQVLGGEDHEVGCPAAAATAALAWAPAIGVRGAP